MIVRQASLIAIVALNEWVQKRSHDLRDTLIAEKPWQRHGGFVKVSQPQFHEIVCCVVSAGPTDGCVLVRSQGKKGYLDNVQPKFGRQTNDNAFVLYVGFFENGTRNRLPLRQLFRPA